MAEDDDPNDERARTNTGRDHKPDHVKRKGWAPKGMVGDERFQPSGPSLGPGGGRRVQSRTNVRNENVSEKAKERADTRPLAVRTGIEALDKQSEASGHRLVSEEELERLRQKAKDDQIRKQGERQANAERAKRQERREREDTRIAREVAEQEGREKDDFLKKEKGHESPRSRVAKLLQRKLGDKKLKEVRKQEAESHNRNRETGRDTLSWERDPE